MGTIFALWHSWGTLYPSQFRKDDHEFCISKANSAHFTIPLAIQTACPTVCCASRNGIWTMKEATVRFYGRKRHIEQKQNEAVAWGCRLLRTMPNKKIDVFFPLLLEISLVSRWMVLYWIVSFFGFPQSCVIMFKQMDWSFLRRFRPLLSRSRDTYGTVLCFLIVVVWKMFCDNKNVK